jgi:hypothetical protein
MKQPKVGAARKRRESYPAKAEAQRKRWRQPEYRERVIAAQRALWADPEHRAKMCAAGFKPVDAEDHHANPTKYSRLSIPNGMRRAEAEAAWDEASKRADMAVRGLEVSGVVPTDVITGTDEELAKAALHAAAVIALGPMSDKRTKLHALKIVLDYTKAKPEERRAISKASNPTDEWMQSVLQADSQPPTEHRRA